MKKVIILRGVSGSGKTTWAKTRLKEKDGLSKSIVSADEYFTDPKTGKYLFVKEELEKSHAFCFKTFILHLQSDTDLIIVDNTNTTALAIAPYVLATEAWGYEYEIKTFHCDPETAYGRGTHGVPFGTIERQCQELSGLPAWFRIENHE